MIDLDGILLVSAVVLIAAILAARLGSRIGLPSLLLFLGLGMAMGRRMGLNFNDPDLARALGFGALVVILAEGGLTTKWTDIRPSIGVAAVLATGGIGDQRGADDAVRLLRPRISTCGSRCCSVRSPRRPTPRRCSRCCATCRSRTGCAERSRPSPV